MLFVGLGTGFGATVVLDGVVEPLELGRFRYRKGTLEDYIGKRGLQRLGHKKWQRHVEYILGRLVAALKPDDVVIGGGNAKKLNPLPDGGRLGRNANAFVGGVRMWGQPAGRRRPRTGLDGRAGPAARSKNQAESQHHAKHND